MLTALRATTKQMQQIADYVTNYAVSATAERKLKIAAHAEAKVLHVVRAILTEIQEAALASTKTELRKTIRAKTTFCCTMGQQTILTNILKTELEIDYAVYSHLPAANSSDDTLVEQAANYHPRYMYTLDVSWFTDNPHVQGTLGVPFNYSIADH